MIPPCRALSALALGVVTLSGAAFAGAEDFHSWAQTPPMGWNSWDCFATTVTESMTREQADVMASKLAVHGWRYVVVDIQWYEPGATGYGYHENAKLAMDGFGRLVPAQNKFPGSRDGGGFKSLSSYVHAKGLGFGIHLMRGIPRQAVEANLPILGTPYHARDIADTVHICPWNSDMYGVDMSRPGAQAYYDSVFALIASWGVDFVKVDDLSRPYVRNEPEIEAVRRAIDRTGRPMVLSTSPGETDIRAAAHVVAHANMWRISDDFWDHWSLLEAQFGRLDKWSVWRTPGAWPDADMIPIGTIELGRKTWFTPTEQKTLMTLWSIARSPLMLGADLTKLDPETLALLTNDEVIAVNQASSKNRQLFRRDDGGIGWVADTAKGDARYVALFNTRDPWIIREANRIWQGPAITMQTPGQKASFEFAVTGLKTVVLVADDSQSPRFWWPPVFHGIRWVMADGREVAASREYGSHGEHNSPIDVPAGAVRLRGEALLDSAARDNAKGEGMSFSAYGYAAGELSASGQPVELKVEALGLGQRVKIRDLWSQRDLGAFTGTFSPEIEWHGARLFRIEPLEP